MDDEPHVLSALKRVLRTYGCRVLQAFDGSSALGILEREQVEVLICDEAMPGMCGTEVLRQAKTISPDTARVLLTAYCDDETVVIPTVNEGEVFRLLSKPWEAETSATLSPMRGVWSLRRGLNGRNVCKNDWAQSRSPGLPHRPTKLVVWFNLLEHCSTM